MNTQNQPASTLAPAFQYSLGVALVPGEVQQRQIYELTAEIASILKLAFQLAPGADALPHVSIFQGRYRDAAEIAQRFNVIDYRTLPRLMPLVGLDIWAEKIIFLDLVPDPILQSLHDKTFDTFFPLAEGKSADPQNFKGITAEEQASFDKTGYPFSRKAYRPHFTLAHLAPESIELGRAAVLAELTRIYQASPLRSGIVFEQAVLFEVGPLGRCLKIVEQLSLAA